MCVICAMAARSGSSFASGRFDLSPPGELMTDYDGEPMGYVNADQRGQGPVAGLPSFNGARAAQQITRTNSTWNGTNNFGPASVTYAFRDTAPGAMPNGTGGFERFSASQIQVAELALQSWSDVANISFTRVRDEGSDYSNNADMLFGLFNTPAASTSYAFAYLPSGPNPRNESFSGDSWYNNSSSDIRNVAGNNSGLLTYGRQTFLHEIGHAIGLSHPGEYNGNSAQRSDAIYYEDTRQYSVMSYWSENFSTTSWGGRHSSGPLLDDIAAAQRLYGANMSTRTGDTTYGFNSNSGRDYLSIVGNTAQAIFAVWDAAGVDTFDFSGYATNQKIDLRAGHFSDVGSLFGNVAIAAGAVIENAIGGSGNDTLIGNTANNLLVGNAGFDLAQINVSLTGATVSVSGGDYIVVSGQGVDTTRGVEEIQFINGSIFTAHVVPTLRTYQMLLDRNANTSEYSTWTTQIQNGGDQGDVVAAVINSSSAAAAAAQSLIDQYYQTYIGRAASASDSSFWNSALRGGDTSLQQLRDALASQPQAGQNEAAFIDATYRGWFGRAATTTEIDVWKGLFARLEASPSDLRIALINDGSGAGFINGQTNALYQTWFGRAATASEQGVWYEQYRAGADYGTLRAALIADGAGRSYIASVTDRLYETWFGRDPSQGELDAWYGLFRDGAEYGALRSALIAEPAGRSYIASVTDRLYETWFGRDPSQGEIDVWYGEFRNGAEYGALRAILIAEPAGRAHIASVVNSRYGDFFGRAPVGAEVDYWYGQFAGGVEQLTLRQTLVYHPTGVARIQEVVAQGYQEYFGRAPTSAETSYWLDQIQRGTEYAQFRAVLDANNAPAPAIEEPAYGVNADSDDLGDKDDPLDSLFPSNGEEGLDTAFASSSWGEGDGAAPLPDFVFVHPAHDGWLL